MSAMEWPLDSYCVQRDSKIFLLLLVWGTDEWRREYFISALWNTHVRETCSEVGGGSCHECLFSLPKHHPCVWEGFLFQGRAQLPDGTVSWKGHACPSRLPVCGVPQLLCLLTPHLPKCQWKYLSYHGLPKSPSDKPWHKRTEGFPGEGPWSGASVGFQSGSQWQAYKMNKDTLSARGKDI